MIYKTIFTAYLSLNFTYVFATKVFTDDQEERFVSTYSAKLNIPEKYMEKALERAIFQPRSYQLQQPSGKVSQPSQRSWERYRRQFIYPAMINRGAQFMCSHRDALHKAREKYGVPPEVILGIIGVETAYGTNTGHYRVLDALATVAFNSPRRVEFFQEELAKYLLMCYKNDWDPEEMRGSIDGGFGIAQFMPSSYLDYAVSYNGDTPDLMIANDAIVSIGNYIKGHGWKSGEPVYLNAKHNGKTCQTLRCNNRELAYSIATWKQNGVTVRSSAIDQSSMADLISFSNLAKNPAWLALDNFFVIFAYNHSNRYALVTYQLGQAVVAKAAKNGCI
ncbi:MAG: mltB [Burkholderiales bacterium]|jgi:membrane-bound lytic murein transglycosylase B|nr:mltB [Burkholderiales bacterium]